MRKLFLLLNLTAAAAVIAAPSDSPTPTPTPNPLPTPSPPTLPVPGVTPTPTPAPLGAENTARNRRDRARVAENLTATDQSNRSADLRVTQDLRKAVMADSSLSLNAKNAKIITTPNAVVLRGPVDTEAERTKLAALAQSAAGPRQLIVELEVRSRR